MPTPSQREIFRTAPAAAKIEARPRIIAAAGQDPNAPPMLSGYAIVWNALSSDRGGYVARFAPNSVRFNDPTLALFTHMGWAVIGNSANGSLRLSQDEYGVKAEIDPPETTTGRDVAALVAGRYITGMSFAYWPEEWTDEVKTDADGNERTVRTYTKGLVDEVSILADPAFTATSIAVAGPEDLARRLAADADRWRWLAMY